MYTYIGFSIATYYMYQALEYASHILGHYNHKYNYIYKLHILHHKKYYPVTDLRSDTFRSNGEGVVAYAPPTLCVVYGFYTILPTLYFVILLFQFGINIGINDYIHKHVHLRESWLDKYEWFVEVRRLHLTHHKKLTTNFSFGYDYTMDKFSHTYLE